MQPFERLRSLARWRDTDDALLVEIAGCLAEFDDDPAGLVVACRRLLDHHRGWGPLWWLCSTVLAAPRAVDAATKALAEVASDTTSSRVAAALPFPPEGVVAVAGWPSIGTRLLDERADLSVMSARVDFSDGPPAPPVEELDAADLGDVGPTHLLVEPTALSERRALVTPGTERVVASCPVTTRIWAIAGVGAVLADPLLAAIVRAVGTLEELSPQRFDRIVGPRGLASPDTLADRIDAPIAPELLRPLP